MKEEQQQKKGYQVARRSVIKRQDSCSKRRSKNLQNHSKHSHDTAINENKENSNSQLTKIFRRIGAKPTVKAFKKQCTDQKEEQTYTNSNNARLSKNVLKMKNQELLSNMKDSTNKMKRIGRKMWVSAYKQQVSNEATQKNNISNTIENLDLPSNLTTDIYEKTNTSNLSSSLKKIKQEKSSILNSEYSNNFVDFKQETAILSNNRLSPNFGQICNTEKENISQVQSFTQKQCYLESDVNSVKEGLDWDEKNSQILDTQRQSYILNNFQNKDSIENYKDIINEPIKQIVQQQQHLNQLHENIDINKLIQEIKQSQPKKKRNSSKRIRKSILEKLTETQQDQKKKKQSNIVKKKNLKSGIIKKPLPPAYPFNYENRLMDQQGSSVNHEESIPTPTKYTSSKFYQQQKKVSMVKPHKIQDFSSPIMQSKKEEKFPELVKADESSHMYRSTPTTSLMKTSKSIKNSVNSKFKKDNNKQNSKSLHTSLHKAKKNELFHVNSYISNARKELQNKPIF